MPRQVKCQASLFAGHPGPVYIQLSRNQFFQIWFSPRLIQFKIRSNYADDNLTLLIIQYRQIQFMNLMVKKKKSRRFFSNLRFCQRLSRHDVGVGWLVWWSESLNGVSENRHYKTKEINAHFNTTEQKRPQASLVVTIFINCVGQTSVQMRPFPPCVLS